MYKKVSEEFKKLIEQQGGRTFKIKLESPSFVIDSGIKKIVYTGGSNSGDSITVGSAVSNYIEVIMEKVPHLITGQQISLDLGLEVNGTIEYMPVGIFKADKPEMTDYEITFKAYDQMTQAEKNYVSDLTYPTTTVNVMNEIKQKLGIEFITNISPITLNNPNTEEGSSNVVFAGYTIREAIGYIAGLYGKFAVFNREGRLEFLWYEESGFEIPVSKCYSFIKNESNYTVNKIIGTAADNTQYEAGSGITGISFSNPFVTQDIINKIHTDIGGFTYRGGETKFLGDCRIDVWDVVTGEDLFGNTYRLPVMEIVHEIDGGLTTTVKSKASGSESVEDTFKGPVVKAMERTHAQLLLVNNLIASKASIEYLEANYIKTDKLSAVEADIENAVITNLQGKFASIEYLEANYAEIDFANVEKASVGVLLNEVGLISSATIVDGHVTGFLDSVKINAGSITAGILDAGTIEVVNLKAANITVGQINGYQIASGAIDMDNLAESITNEINSASSNAQTALAEALKAFNESQAAASAAGTAQATADGKNTVYYQSSAPATAKKNDIWFNTAKDNQMSIYDGSKWVAEQFGAGAIANNTITSTQIAAEVNTKIDNAFTNAGSALAAANSASTTANNALNAFNNLEIGGRNLFPKSKYNNIESLTGTISGYGIVLPKKPNTSYGNVVVQSKQLDTVLFAIDKTYTVQFVAWSDGNTVLCCDIYPDTYGMSMGLPNDTGVAITTTKKRYVFTGKLENSSGLVPMYLRFWRLAGNPDYKIIISDIMIESGNKASTWTPAPEDLESSISYAQASADGKNKITYDPNPPSGTHKVNDTWFDTDNGNKMYYWNGSAWTAKQFGTNAIANASITNALIADATIQSAKIANLDAGKITTGTLDAARIGANTITAAKIAVGDFTNYASWKYKTVDTIPFPIIDLSHWTVDTSVYRTSKASYKYVGTGVGVMYDIIVPVTVGEEIYIEYWYKTDFGWTCDTGNSKLRFGDANNNLLMAWSISNTAQTSWTNVSGTYKVTAAAGAYIRVSLSMSGGVAGKCAWVDDIIIKKKSGGNLIVDGAITAIKLSANAVTAGKIAANAVTAGTIASGAISTDKLAANAVTAAKMAVGTITAASGIIANAAILTANIKDLAVTGAKIADVAIGTAKIADAAVTNAKIANLSVTNAKIADATIESAKIKNLDATKITSGYIDAARIKANSITANKMAIADFTNYAQLNDFTYSMWGFMRTADTSGSIYQVSSLSRDKFISEYQTVNGSETFRIKGQISTSVKADSNSAYVGTAIGIYCYNGSKVSVGIVYSTRITATASAPWTSIDSTVTIPETARYIRIFIQTNASSNFSGVLKVRNIEVLRAASSELIVDGAITAGKLSANAVTADKISAGAITTAKIAAGAITSGTIASGAISTDKLAANAVTAAKIASRTITADRIVSGAITANEIAASAITTDKLAANSITAAKIASGAITADKIAAGAVTATKISVTSLEAIVAKIGGFTIDSNSLYNGIWGTTGSVMMCTGTGTSKSIAGSGSINGWCFTAGDSFGVTKNGKLYASSAVLNGQVITNNLSATGGRVGGWNINDRSIYADYNYDSSTVYRTYLQTPAKTTDWVISIQRKKNSGNFEGLTYIQADGVVQAKEIRVGQYSNGPFIKCRDDTDKRLELINEIGPVDVSSKAGWAELRSFTDYVYLISNNGIKCENVAETAYVPIHASSFTVNSSLRYKNPLGEMTEDEANKLLELKVVKFDYKRGKKNQYGLYAEETIDKISQCVEVDEHGRPDGIDYSKLVPFLIKKAQMQESKINYLENMVTHLIGIAMNPARVKTYQI